MAEIEKKERLLLSKARGNPNSCSSRMKTLFLQSQPQFHPVSYFAPHSPEIADNEEEISDSHSFDEQNHAMNEYIGGNVADITSEVEMAG